VDLRALASPALTKVQNQCLDFVDGIEAFRPWMLAEYLHLSGNALGNIVEGERERLVGNV
jgi:hypothetical protein